MSEDLFLLGDDATECFDEIKIQILFNESESLMKK